MPSYSICRHDVCYTINAEEGSLIGQRIQETGAPYEDWLCEHIYAARFKGTAVDVGASIGNHTLWFALVCGLPVVAFEPLTITELQRNLDINSGNPKVHSVKIVPMALGSAVGHAHDVGQRVLTGAGTSREERASGIQEGKLEVGEGPIPVATLDSYDLLDVAFIKIDVEGMEPDVLRGGEHTIKRQRPVLFTEAPNQAHEKKIAEVIGPWGYRRTARFKRGTPIIRWDG